MVQLDTNTKKPLVYIMNKGVEYCYSLQVPGPECLFYDTYEFKEDSPRE